MKRKSHKQTRPVPIRTPKRQVADRGALPHPDSDLTPDEANELARQLNELICHNSHVRAWAQVERAATMREYDRLLSIYGPTLQRFINSHSDDPADGVSLPTGTLYIEEWPAQFHVEDEETALRWCREHSDVSINVVISLPGNFEPMLTKFMKRELPMYLNDESVFSRSVNPTRLYADWHYEGFEGMPDGCSLQEAQLRVFVTPHKPKQERRGGDNDT